MFGFDSAFDFLQIIWLDVVLSGDNALIIAMAAAGLSPQLRQRAIYFGMALAAVIRIVCAVGTTYLLAIPGIKFAGGLLLAWVCWRFYRELRHRNRSNKQTSPQDPEYTGPPRRSLMSALITITIADFSMSIDNVLAVAAIARENIPLLVFGLVLSIALMAFFATMIMRLLVRRPWISYIGLGFLIYVASDMLIHGWPEVLHVFTS